MNTNMIGKKTTRSSSLIMNYRKITATILVIFMMTLNVISALPSSFDSSLNDLYENLLQREYAGPISFPNHQLERKAQRSPSLRLRFGRSDPDFLQSMEKRWFGDVRQKPIRSPSLRLRFGRRSDPMVPLRDSEINSNDDRARREAILIDNPQNNGEAQTNDVIRIRRDIASGTHMEEKRAPSLRLRFGRDPFKISAAQAMSDRNELNGEILASLLQALNEYDYNDFNSDSDDFTRETRKPAPLRLRFGRSVNSISTNNAPTSTNRNSVTS